MVWDRSRWARTGCVGLCLGLGACGASPFSRSERDRGRPIPIERLRAVEGEDLSAYARPERAEAARSRFEGVERVALTLEECRASALTHNLDLRVAMVSPTLAAERVGEEEARFESAFTLRALWQELDQPTVSQLASSQFSRQLVEPGVRIPLRTGGSASVSLPMSRSQDDNSFSTQDVSYTSDLELSISHPLLRGAGRRAATSALRIASYERGASEAQAKLEVVRQLAAVDRAYWRLYQAQGELEVRQRQYEVAQAQLESARRRVRAGTAAEIEVTRASAGLADRLELIIVAQANLLDRQREIKRVVNLPGLTLEGATLVVASSPPDPVAYEFDRGALLAKAVRDRAEMLELELRLAADAARLSFERNQALPLLSLDYTYRVNGLGDTLGRSAKTLSKNEFEDWELGLSAEVPLGNEAARSRVRSAILARLQRLSTREARERAITQEVLAACDAIDAGWQRILAARQSAILNARTLQAEQRNFEVGNSTSTNVLDASARLAEAQSAEVRALADYQVAQVDLAFATGTLLGAGRVEWAPAPTPDPARVGPGMEVE